MWQAPWMHSHSLGACWKCGGSGRIEAYRYIEGGVCFACDGTGSVRGRKKGATKAQSVAPVPVAPKAPEIPKRRLSAAEAREIGKRALEDAAHWFKILEDPSKLYPGTPTPEMISEIHKYIGQAIGQSVVDRPLFEAALKKARAKIGAEYWGPFENGVRDGMVYADRDYANVDMTSVPRR